MVPTPGRVVTRADIARRTAVRRPVVSNWQRRHADFPGVVSRSDEGVELFSEAEVQTWLDGRVIPANARLAGEGAGATYGDRFRPEDTATEFLAAVRALVGDPQHFGDHVPLDHYLLLLMALIHLRQLRPETWRACVGRPDRAALAVREFLRENGRHQLSDLVSRLLERCPPHMLAGVVGALDTGEPEKPTTSGFEAGASAFDLLLAAYGEVAGGTAGELPTPPAVARAVAGMLMGEPPSGEGTLMRLHDPYCRGGEMLAASVDAVRATVSTPLRLSVSGAGAGALQSELAGMNLAQRGQPADLRPEPEPGPGPGPEDRGSGPGARFDRVLVNPPFNARLSSGSGGSVPHWRYGDPPLHNANYDWLQ
ncbi:MAG TPA: N-6 DNA methylase, partial [Streptomyces sp.]|uniref:N-6 DNA methylase n=1 Tax=Streptomyces sp. TaxID=1931 RepID=UPI002B7814B8